MAWVNDLASPAGIPAGAATVAVAMYAACTAAEKAARPEALQDIDVAGALVMIGSLIWTVLRHVI